jgi:hypothetical protein
MPTRTQRRCAVPKVGRLLNHTVRLAFWYMCPMMTMTLAVGSGQALVQSRRCRVRRVTRGRRPLRGTHTLLATTRVSLGRPNTCGSCGLPIFLRSRKTHLNSQEKRGERRSENPALRDDDHDIGGTKGLRRRSFIGELAPLEHNKRLLFSESDCLAVLRGLNRSRPVHGESQASAREQTQGSSTSS